MGVWAAPQKTEMNPSAANNSIGALMPVAKLLPRVAPMKKRGVTSPPLKPEPRVTTVRTNFHNQLHVVTPPAQKADGSVMALGFGLETLNPR